MKAFLFKIVNENDNSIYISYTKDKYLSKAISRLKYRSKKYFEDKTNKVNYDEVFNIFKDNNKNYYYEIIKEIEYSNKYELDKIKRLLINSLITTGINILNNKDKRITAEEKKEKFKIYRKKYETLNRKKINEKQLIYNKTYRDKKKFLKLLDE